MAELPAPGMSAQWSVDGAAGPIEALVAMPRGTPRGIAVVCHPHPLMGGALTNKVTYTLASLALKCDLVTLRFNFRGVGGSAGEHDGGAGETDDVVTVVEALRAAAGNGPLLLAGFSFGAFVSLRAAHRVQPSVQVSVAPPLSRFVGEGMGLPEPPGCPWLLVHSRDDEVVPFEQSDRFLESYDPPPERIAMDGCGHFFHGRLPDLTAVVQPFVERHLPER